MGSQIRKRPFSILEASGPLQSLRVSFPTGRSPPRSIIGLACNQHKLSSAAFIDLYTEAESVHLNQELCLLLMVGQVSWPDPEVAMKSMLS